MSLIRACFKSRRLRWLAAVTTALLTALVIADFCMEYIGVPDVIRRCFEHKARQYGYTLTLSSLRAGLWNGIIGTDVSLTAGADMPQFRASRVQLRISPVRFFRGELPFVMRVAGATAALPLFPESGAEGSLDRLLISNVDASLSGAPGRIRINRASGSLNGIRFAMHGTVRNLLYYSSAKWLDSFHSEPEKTEERKPAAAPAAQLSAPPANPYVEFVRGIPLPMRRKALRTLHEIYSQEFSGAPACTLEFDLDIMDFNQSTARAEFTLPAFRYNGIRIHSIHEEASLKNGIFSLDRISVKLGKDSFIDANGTYDASYSAATGRVRGRCRFDDLVRLLGAPAQNSALSSLGVRADLVDFEGTLENFNLSSGSCKGLLSLHVQDLSIQKLGFHDISLELKADGQSLNGTLRNASLRGGGNIYGTFQLDNEHFSASLNGKANAANHLKVLPPNIAALVQENVQLHTPANSTSVSVQGELSFPLRNIDAITGNFRVQLNNLQLTNIPVTSIVSDVKFSSEAIILRNIEALLPGGSRVTGRLRCEPGMQSISASVVCSGSPSAMLEAFGKSNRDFVNSLTRDIKWPTAPDTIELSADLSADYGKAPFYFLTGTMVIRDFAYNRIPFRYGAARFIIDAENHLILPDVILETAEGKMRISADYRPSGKDLSFKKPDGILNFQLSSTIAGNDMIRTLYPAWRTSYIDFPFPMAVEASGVIDYSNAGNTRFRALITNGSCRWQGIRITDLDTLLLYENATASFRSGEGHFCGGRLQMDYRYNFNTEKGNISARLTSANMLSVLQGFRVDAGKTPEEYKNALLSMNLDAAMSYKAGSRLQLDGNGQMTISGSNLWTVPLLGSFLRIIGQVWSLESFGSITKINGDFQLAGEKLEFEDLRSNGGLVSLNARGNYRWADNSFDVRVRAELLRNTLPFDAMSHLLTPVSWIMERRLKGNFNTYKWE